MKKKLDVGNITNELKGASLFFTKTVAPPPLAEPEKPVIERTANPLVDSPFFEKTPISLSVEKKIEKEIERKINTQKHARVEQPINRDTTTPRNHETMVSRYHDTIIELVRKAVKELGKEAATHRFTIAEKNAIADIIYTYKSHGVRTSENEIARIAVNFIIEDYKENGENSILEKTLKALNE